MPIPVKVQYVGQHIKIRESNKSRLPFLALAHLDLGLFPRPWPTYLRVYSNTALPCGTWRGSSAVLAGTGLAGIRGQLPGVEPAPYILRFTEDRPNPLYRKICYTFAWSDVVTFATLNLAGLAVAAVTGSWYLKQIYQVRILPALRPDPPAGRIRHPAARAPLNKRRRHRAALLLRVGLGRHAGSDSSARSVEDPAPQSHGGRRRTGGLHRSACSRGLLRYPGIVATHPSHRPRRTDGWRLNAHWRLSRETQPVPFLPVQPILPGGFQSD